MRFQVWKRLVTWPCVGWSGACWIKSLIDEDFFDQAMLSVVNGDLTKICQSKKKKKGLGFWKIKCHGSSSGRSFCVAHGLMQLDLVSFLWEPYTALSMGEPKARAAANGSRVLLQGRQLTRKEARTRDERENSQIIFLSEGRSHYWAREREQLMR